MDGTYEVFINPSGTATGIVTVDIHDVPPDVTTRLVVGAAGTPMVVTTPGQNLAPTFVVGAATNVQCVSRPVGATSIGYTVLSSSGAILFHITSRTGNRRADDLP